MPQPASKFDEPRSSNSSVSVIEEAWAIAPDLRAASARIREARRLPADVVEATRKRYVEAYERLTGRSFADWLA